MAEALCPVAGILQITNAGLKLATSLYNFGNSVGHADQDISGIAGVVELTANALTCVGKVFENENGNSLASKQAIQDANNLINRNEHRKRMGRVEDDKCECGEVESVLHVLTECPLLQAERLKLEHDTELKADSLSSLLGGKPPNEADDGQNNKNNKWKIIAAQLKGVLEFAKKTNRFVNRDKTSS